MNWNDSKIATWYASVPLDSDSNIISAESFATSVKLKTVSVKGQNTFTTSEPDDFGYIGNAFKDIFHIQFFDNIYRKTEQDLGSD